MKRIFALLIMLILMGLLSSRLLGQEAATQTQQPALNPPQQNINPAVLPNQPMMGMPKIGYVDVSKVFDDYSHTKQSKAVLDKEIKIKEEKVREMETELRQLREDFETQKATLSDEVKAQKEALIKDKSDQIQNFTDQAEEELSNKEAKLTEDIVGEIYSMINSIGDKDGFSVILDKSNLIYGYKGLDLTDRILKELEAKK